MLLPVLAVLAWGAVCAGCGIQAGRWLAWLTLRNPLRLVLRYLAPGTVWRDTVRCWTTGRWT